MARYINTAFEVTIPTIIVYYAAKTFDPLSALVLGAVDVRGLDAPVEVHQLA